MGPIALFVRRRLDGADACITAPYGLIFLDNALRTAFLVSFERFTGWRLGQVASGCKPPGNTGGLPHNYEDRRTEARQFAYPGDVPDR